MPQNAPNQSLRRAVRILYAIAGAEDGRTPAQIAARVDLKPNTAGRFLRTLELEKLVVRRERPLRYLLGPAVAELKHLDDTRHLLDIAGRVLVRAQASFAEASLSLVEAENGETYSRLLVVADQPGRIQLLRAQLHLPYEKASSMVFLAHATPYERDAFFKAHPFSRHGAKIWGSRKALAAFLGEVTRKGYAEPDFPDKDQHRLAAPVFGGDGALVAVVGAYMPQPVSPRDRRRLRDLALAAARRIGEALDRDRGPRSVSK